MKNVCELAGKVLIVGSDLELGRSIQQNLHRAGGYDSIVIDDGNQVLDILSRENIEVVLTDHQLSNCTGFELAFEIRKDRITKPEIIMFSTDPNVSVFEAHQVGMAHVMQKPVNMNELMSVMKKVIGEKRRFERLDIEPTAHGALKGEIVEPHSKKRSHDLAITNIGRGGFFFRVDHESQLPAIGQVIDFKINLTMIPDHYFAGRGIVRWTKTTQDEVGAGVEFLIIPEDSEKLITAFVDLFKIRQFVPSES